MYPYGLAHPDVDAHEVLPLLCTRQRDVHPLLKATPQRLINSPWEVGGGQHHHLPPFAILLAVDPINLQYDQSILDMS